jgi:hypothetical protein
MYVALFCDAPTAKQLLITQQLTAEAGRTAKLLITQLWQTAQQNIGMPFCLMMALRPILHVSMQMLDMNLTRV